MADVVEMTGAQLKFLKELLADLAELFFMINPDKEPCDFVGGMAGLLKKGGFSDRDYYRELEEVQIDIYALSGGKARRLIRAMLAARERLDNKLPREMVKTPHQILKALFVAKRDLALDDDQMRDMVFDVTKGATRSRGQLRREEGVEILRSLGRDVKIFEFVGHEGHPRMRKKQGGRERMKDEG